jgi:SEC-C motif-containing protein
MNCYCRSGQTFANCCQPFHQGKRFPETAEQLMRSRFSAYCEGSDASVQYVAASYHPLNQPTNPSHEIAAFAKAAHFVRLDVIHASGVSELPAELLNTLPPQDDFASRAFATVHFKVQFLMNDRLHILEEISRFIATQDRWSYLDGTLIDHPLQKLSRNDSCPCGSGKKYKNCRPHLSAGQTVE